MGRKHEIYLVYRTTEQFVIRIIRARPTQGPHFLLVFLRIKSHLTWPSQDCYKMKCSSSHFSSWRVEVLPLEVQLADRFCLVLQVVENNWASATFWTVLVAGSQVGHGGSGCWGRGAGASWLFRVSGSRDSHSGTKSRWLMAGEKSTQVQSEQSSRGRRASQGQW